MTKPSLLDDQWILPLSGEKVIQCRYDYAFTMVIGELEPSFIVRIEQPFSLHSPEGDVDSVDPAVDMREMGGTLRLVHGTVARSVAHKDGRLEIDFEDGSLVRVSPSDDYEPWHLSGPDGVMMVSIPGGDLVVWS